MSAESPIIPPVEVDERPTPQEFKRFIRSLSLEQIRLIRVDCESFTGVVDQQIDAQVDYKANADIDISPERIEIKQNLFLDIIGKDGPCGRIAVTLGLAYLRTEQDEGQRIHILIREFVQTTVLFNAWPYLREICANITTRFGWPPMLLPLYKVEAPAAGDTHLRDKKTSRNTKERSSPSSSRTSKPKGT